MVGTRAGQPPAQLRGRRGQHVPGVHRRRARGTVHTRLPGAVRDGRAPVPHADAVHRDVRARPRGAAGLPAGVRAAPGPLLPALRGHRDVRAAVLSSYGSAPEPAERPDPVAGPGQELIRVTAAPIVPLDLLCATGTSYFGAPPLPYVPGVQGV